MTLVNAFAESRNIPALKLAAHVGIHKVIDMAHRFGVTVNIPAYLPIAIGAVEITLQEQVASYSVFPNDGLRVAPRLIRKVSNADGITLWDDNPEVKEVIDQQTARTMMIFLQAVTAYGTGHDVAVLKHPFGGKTGTTSDYTDAWFLGFSPSVTCGVWVGYDSRQSLGDKETGAKAALPIWMSVMKVAIAGKDDEQFIGEQEAPADQKNPLLQAAAPPPPAKPASAGTPTKVPAALVLNGTGTKPPAQAAAKPPSALAATGPGAKPPAQAAAKPTSASTSTKTPAASPAAKPPSALTATGPVTKPTAPPATKPAVLLNATASVAKPPVQTQAKPASPPQPAPAKPKPAVKPIPTTAPQP